MAIHSSFAILICTFSDIHTALHLPYTYHISEFKQKIPKADDKVDSSIACIADIVCSQAS